MTLGIRRLHPAYDRQLFEHSFSWLRNSPTGRRQTEDVFGTLDREEYLAAATDERRIDIGVFADKYFFAKVTLHLTARRTYEVSLEADRNAPVEGIVLAGQLIRAQLFGLYGAQLVFAWVPRWAKGVQAILTTIGFQPTGVTMLHGTSRGRLIEWVQFTLRADDEQQEQTTNHPHAEPGV